MHISAYFRFYLTFAAWLISRPYVIAMVSCILEYVVEDYFQPDFKQKVSAFFAKWQHHYLSRQHAATATATIKLALTPRFCAASSAGLHPHHHRRGIEKVCHGEHVSSLLLQEIRVFL